MESFEMLMAFFVFLTMLSLYIPLVDVDGDYTLQQYLLAEDIWRVMYLKHGLAFYYPIGVEAELSADLDQLAQMTNLCIEYETTAGGLHFSYVSPYCPPRSGNVVVIREPRVVGESVLSIS